ncbi:MAG: cupin domain-containing protein [Bacteroidota bacterium]|nr:cupin domain-containing protein [Bacteroidota bacterium]
MEQAKNALSNEDWIQADGYQKGTYAKILRDENGGKTMLLQLPKGFYMPPHSHITTEQHFVLDGEYISNDVTYTVGTYQRFAPGDEHGPFSSETGALILVCWDPLEIKKAE